MCALLPSSYSIAIERRVTNDCGICDDRPMMGATHTSYHAHLFLARDELTHHHSKHFVQACNISGFLRQVEISRQDVVHHDPADLLLG